MWEYTKMWEDAKVKNPFSFTHAGNELLSSSSLSTGWFCLGLEASLFELKISVKEEVQQARTMLLKLHIYCEWRRGGREEPLWYHSEIHTYFPLFSAYQKLKNSSEMTARILTEHRLMGSILSQWLWRCKGNCWKSSRCAEDLVSIRHRHHTITKLQVTLTSHRWQRPRRSSP